MNIFQKIFRKNEALTHKDWAILGVGLSLFGLLSLGNMARWSVWFDEAYGLYLIRFNFLEVAKYTSTDVHPPLYYWMLKIWQTWFGNSEIALRSLSMVMIMIAIVFVYLLVRRAFGVRVGAWTIALLALSPMLIRYSEEARMYGVVMAIVAAATYVLVDVTHKPARWKWVIYGVLVSLGMWTHYFTAIMWITHWAWRYIALRRKNIRKTAKVFWTKEWVWAHVLAIGLFLPWLPYMVKQMATVQGGGFWIGPISVTTPFNFLTNIFMYRENHEVQGWLAILMLFVMATTIVSLILAYRKLRGEQRSLYVLMLVMAIVPLLLLLGLSLPPLRPSFVDRYLLPSVPFWFAAIGIAFATVMNGTRPRVAVPVVVALFATLSLGVAQVYTIGNYNKNANDPLPIRQTVDAMKQRGTAGEPILSSTSWRFYEMHYYDSMRNPVYFEATDNLTWGSYDMLRKNSYRKVYSTTDFAREHGGTIWYVGDWKTGHAALPKEGSWEILQEVKAEGVADDQSSIRAVEIRLKD